MFPSRTNAVEDKPLSYLPGLGTIYSNRKQTDKDEYMKDESSSAKNLQAYPIKTLSLIASGMHTLVWEPLL